MPLHYSDISVPWVIPMGILMVAMALQDRVFGVSGSCRWHPKKPCAHPC